MYRDCKSDTADVTLASLTGTERCIDSHKHVTVRTSLVRALMYCVLFWLLASAKGHSAQV